MRTGQVAFDGMWRELPGYTACNDGSERGKYFADMEADLDLSARQ